MRSESSYSFSKASEASRRFRGRGRSGGTGGNCGILWVAAHVAGRWTNLAEAEISTVCRVYSEISVFDKGILHMVNMKEFCFEIQIKRGKCWLWGRRPHSAIQSSDNAVRWCT